MKKDLAASAPTRPSNGDDILVSDIRALIEETRSAVAQAVNTGMTLLYWQIGKRICEDILGNQRTGYGDAIIATLSRQLSGEYGRGFF